MAPIDVISDLLKALRNVSPAIAAGAIGSFLTEWTKWGIESRRDRREARRNLIREARDILGAAPPKADFRETSLYFQLLPYLSGKTRSTMTSTLQKDGSEVIELVAEANKVVVDPYADLILQDLAQLERRWGVI